MATDLGGIEGTVEAFGGDISAMAGGGPSAQSDPYGGGFGGNDTGLGADTSTVGQNLGTAAQLSAGAFSNMLHSGADVLASMKDAALKNLDWNVGVAFSYIGVTPDVVQLDMATGQYSSPPGPNSVVIDVWNSGSSGQAGGH